MVAQNTVRTYGVNQVFPFVEDIWLHRKSRQIQFFSGKTNFTTYVRNMFWAAILYKYHDSTSLGNPTNTARVLNILSLNEFKAINATIWIGKSIFKPFIFYDRNIVNILSPSSMWTLRGSIQPESGPIHRWELCGFIHLSSLPWLADPVWIRLF